ncbi:hypothetical protein ETC05_08190 [Geobacillus sp. BMUD]|nr:hypothetical protein [Geobacillus sp. BMUD]
MGLEAVWFGRPTVDPILGKSCKWENFQWHLSRKYPNSKMCKIIEGDFHPPVGDEFFRQGSLYRSC